MSSSSPITHVSSNSLATLANPAFITPMRLEERNRIAREFISRYARKHAAMDVAVGAAGLLPFLSIPTLIAAIAAQSPLIYQPLARDLAAVYLAEPDHLEQIKTDVIHPQTIETAKFDIAANFGTEFMMQIASDLLADAGLGALAASAVPLVGAAVGAALDYLIATQMTWRVGSMVSMYFQNGGAWVDSQKHTFELAKKLTGPMHVGVIDLLDGKFKKHTPRVDLNDIRQIPSVRQNLLRSLRSLISILRAAAGDEQIREILKARRIPIDLINEVLGQLE